MALYDQHGRRNYDTTQPVTTRVYDIMCEFDRWLASQVMRAGLTWDEMPKLNDAMREYFASTRTEKT